MFKVASSDNLLIGNLPEAEMYRMDQDMDTDLFIQILLSTNEPCGANATINNKVLHFIKKSLSEQSIHLAHTIHEYSERTSIPGVHISLMGEKRRLFIQHIFDKYPEIRNNAINKIYASYFEDNLSIQEIESIRYQVISDLLTDENRVYGNLHILDGKGRIFQIDIRTFLLGRGRKIDYSTEMDKSELQEYLEFLLNSNYYIDDENRHILDSLGITSTNMYYLPIIDQIVINYKKKDARDFIDLHSL